MSCACSLYYPFIFLRYTSFVYSFKFICSIFLSSFSPHICLSSCSFNSSHNRNHSHSASNRASAVAPFSKLFSFCLKSSALSSSRMAVNIASQCGSVCAVTFSTKFCAAPLSHNCKTCFPDYLLCLTHLYPQLLFLQSQ